MLVLASGSPRRREILDMLGYEYLVHPAQADETLPEGTEPEKGVAELSYRKAKAVADRYPEDTVIGADTVVFCNGAVLGKPSGREEAAEMLRILSGRTHVVYTGVTVISKGRCETVVSASDVTFFSLTEEEISRYLNTGEPYDKAGAYAVQGKGSVLVRSIAGDYYSVMGLPAGATARLLASFGEKPRW